MVNRGCRRSNHARGSHWNDSSGNSVGRRRTLNLGCLNADGWSEQSKLDVLSAIEAKNIDIFSVLETKKRVEDKDKLKVPGFDIFESRREEAKKDKKGGGIACLVRKSSGILVKEHLPKISQPELQYVAAERLWLTYQSQQGKTALCTVYLGFNHADDRHLAWNQGILSVLSDEIRDLRERGFRVLLQGDFNCHVGSDLGRGGIPGNNTQMPNKNGELFLNFLSCESLIHLNGAVREEGVWSTRICQGKWTRYARDHSSSTILDYVLISSEHIGTVLGMSVDEEGYFGGDSDHNMIFSSFSDKFISLRRGPLPNKQVWDVSEDTDFNKFKTIVQREMDSLGSCGPGVEGLSDGLTRALYKGLHEGVGKKILLPERATLFPKHIVALIKERKVLERALKTLKCQFASSHHQAPPTSLLVARDNLDAKTEELERAKSLFARQRRAPLVNLAKGKTRRDRKRFWTFVSRKSKKAGDIPTLQDSTGKIRHEPGEISEGIHLYLKEIFSGSDQDTSTLPNGDDVDDSEPVVDEVPHVNRDHEYGANNWGSLPEGGQGRHPTFNPSSFLDKQITVDEVQDVIKKLEFGKAAGHDEVTNEALKHAPDSFLHRLTVLFNRVKNQSVVPRAWKRGRVVLVHKKGSVCEVGNYRPITVLTAMNAIYSKVLNSRLTEVVERHNLLGEAQFGFRKGRSGADAGFTLSSVLWKSSAKRRKPHLAFLDLQKAYDSVDRSVLWAKLRKLGFGGKFLESIKSMYSGDYVTCESNGVTTNPVYLRRGLRQGCSLSPMLFALYIVDMSRDLVASRQGVTLHRVCISVILFADDIVLVGSTVQGLQLLQDIVQHHCNIMKMKLSISKSKVMSYCDRRWELRDGDEVLGCFDATMQFKYLGVETSLCPGKGARAMQKRALDLAKSYKGACLRIARDGPDIVDLALSLWQNIAIPSVLYGCESVPFSKQTMVDVARQQSCIGKFTLGLPSCAPNISSFTILGIKPFKHLLYSAQLKFYVRLSKQGDERWSKDALLDHLVGGWSSPYLKLLLNIKNEVGMDQWPISETFVDIVLDYHFVSVANEELGRLSLPAFEPVSKRMRMSHVNESDVSKVS